MKEKILWITVGPPGSGKNYTAEQIMPKENIFSTDDFYMKNGKYEWDSTQIGTAHEWNRRRVENAMQRGITPIASANTNITEWERKPYKQLAQKYGYTVKILHSDSPWFKDIHPRLKDKTFTDKDVMEFFIRNSHNVPFDSIKKMMNRWEEDKNSLN